MSTLRADAQRLVAITNPATASLCLPALRSGIDLALISHMASKEFRDPSGMTWHVWNTVPISGAVINPGFEKGWLTFESDAGALRRLAPIPADWERMSAERLVELLRDAAEVPRHTGPMRRVARAEDDAPDRA